MADRVSTKDLDQRLRTVEQRLSEMTCALERIEEQARQAHVVVSEPGTGLGANGYHRPEQEEKIARLEAIVGRLDDRVEKITQTIVTQQASRFS